MFPGVTYVKGDYSQAYLLKKLLDQHQEVIHLAYSTVPNTSFENPISDLLQNLPPSIQLFSEAALRGIKLILVSSGGAVYGDIGRDPIKENYPVNPISPYGVTKLTIEKYAYLYSITHNLNYICIRPSNVYGRNQQAFTGQGFIATAIASILTNKPIKIYGKNGSIRDYIHVSDLVSGILSVIHQGRLSETYNIGSGIGYSNIDIIEKISLLIKETRFKAMIDFSQERLFDVKVNVLDSSKLNAHTGWVPKLDIYEGLSDTIKYLQTLVE